MNPALIPGICGLSLITMLGFVGKHWLEVRNEVMVFHGRPALAQPAPPASPAQAAVIAKQVPVTQPLEASPTPPAVASVTVGREPTKRTPSQSEQKFYELLIEKLQNLEQQNNELRDQIAEANRSQMELEFRFDTLSSSFRPLRVMEDTETALDQRDSPPFQDIPQGVLPPRAIVPMEDLPAH